ncbi:hypothetical protein [Halobacterium sp. R2-5]|uniref:hypothetical protein n=1 Tax=Halobacterium sp. R2-5 TaxID=2715751 RepID=UPI00141FDB84|nr:hypothetical protein [Halobacterium sp. R2-5]NIC00002.1 hypothetical protein [Halobacterium sp. R2-5]
MYDAIADLPVVVDSVSLDRVERETAAFTRATTVVALSGDGEAGRGEDVTYETAHHDALAEHEADTADGGAFDLAGEYTFAEFAATLDETDLWPVDDPDREDFRHYRRWGFEAAALDLALRQAGETLGERLDRSLDPVRFVVSGRLPEGDTKRVETLLDRYPDAELKLDPTTDWPDGTFDFLADTDAVRVLDLKGHYEGTDVDQSPDPALYERVFEGFPDATVEDPAVTAATRGIVSEHAGRVAWDAPIHGLDDVRDAPFDVRRLNVKPSRFGTLESLFETLEWAFERDVALYGGGQFELSVGRGQIQELASLFYPAGPNDVAPGAYNDPRLPDDPPRSPISPPEDHVGFGL